MREMGKNNKTNLDIMPDPVPTLRVRLTLLPAALHVEREKNM
jgi:hypothetical protein